MSRRRYAVIGIGQRAGHFLDALLGPHADSCELVALCDASLPALEQRAAAYRARGFAGGIYAADDFERMLAESRAEEVIVLTPDHTHAEYLDRALRAGCDAFTEKPMCISADQCQRIVDAQRETGRRVRVGFNYRYAPWNRKIKELLRAGVIGRVVSANRRHAFNLERGPFFFHRWHAQLERSGGLLVHKSTHYLDLLNFFLASVPKRVFARGEQNYYSDRYAEELGLEARGRRCGACPSAARCPFFFDYRWQAEDVAAIEARGRETGYYRDECCFRAEADAPDTMHVLVEYESGALLNYQLVACGGGPSDEILYGTHGQLWTTGSCLRVVPYYGEPYEVRPERAAGDHGGADPLMFRDAFDPAAPADPNRCAADQYDGAWSVLIGVAAQRSMRSGEPVLIRELVAGLEHPDYAPTGARPDGFTAERMRAHIDAQRKQE